MDSSGFIGVTIATPAPVKIVFFINDTPFRLMMGSQVQHYPVAMASVQIALRCQQLRHQHGAAGGAADGVVGQADKLVVVLAVLAQAADRDAPCRFPDCGPAWSAGGRPPQSSVRNCFGSGGQMQLLRVAGEGFPGVLDLLNGWLFLKGYKDRGKCGRRSPARGCTGW